jgi:predicted dehydrogenase
MSCTRRVFLTSASGLVVGARLAAASVRGANTRVRVGIIGTGGRARGLMNQLKSIAGVEIVAVCDVFEPRLLQAAEIAGPAALKSGEYRRLLDNREIDAVLIGTPDHWHKDMTLDAVAAGKDVYVEKPVSHSIEEGAEMVRVIEASKQIVQTGTQQRSWTHWIQGKELVQSGRLGQITFVHAYWYQHARPGSWPEAAPDKLDWKRWLGPAPDQPYRPERFYQWRHFWDFGGGCLTDLMTHWIDVVHWYMNVEAPLSAYASGKNYNLKSWEAPDTVTATLEFPNDFTCAYLGTYVSRVDDGGLEFRGELGTLKIDRTRLAFYKDDAPYAPGRLTPEPEIVIPSSADGSLAHLQNWIDCIRSRQTPNAHIRVAHQAARTAHLANLSLRAGKPRRWNHERSQIEAE